MIISTPLLHSLRFLIHCPTRLLPGSPSWLHPALHPTPLRPGLTKNTLHVFYSPLIYPGAYQGNKATCMRKERVRSAAHTSKVRIAPASSSADARKEGGVCTLRRNSGGDPPPPAPQPQRHPPPHPLRLSCHPFHTGWTTWWKCDFE